MYVGVFSTKVLKPSCGSFLAAWKKKPEVMARRMRLKLRPAEVTSKRYRSIMVRSCLRTSCARRNERAWR